MPYIGKEPEHGNYQLLDALTLPSGVFDGSRTVFNLTTDSVAVYPTSPTTMIISLGGVIQEPNATYTVSGNQITFTTAPAASTTFFGVSLGDTLDIGTPSDGSVTIAKMANNSVDSAELAAGSVDIAHLSASGSASSSTFLAGNNAWVAAGGGDVTREGGNTDGSGSYQTNSIEATTTSTSDVDLLPVSDLGIAATSPINFLLNIRKTAGAVGQAWVGLKLNTTVVQEGAGNISFQSTNREESGIQVGWIGARIGSDYLRPALIITTSTNGWNQLTPGYGVSTFRAANTPTVAITDFVIMGKSGSASLTLGVDELHIYSLAVS